MIGVKIRKWIIESRSPLLLMKSLLILVLMSGTALLSISSCATVRTEPLTSGEVRLISIEVAQREELRQKRPFPVKIQFEADGTPEIQRVCFLWSGKGPFCSKVKNVDYGPPGAVTTQIIQLNAGRYFLETYFLYTRDGKTETTNVVDMTIRIFGP
jgi:hypothetical protein